MSGAAEAAGYPAPAATAQDKGYEAEQKTYLAEHWHDQKPAVVIDNGTGRIKCGLITQLEAPSCVFPNVRATEVNGALTVATRKYQEDNLPAIGYEALAKRQLAKLVYPMEHGYVLDYNWEHMEEIWRHVFTDCLTIGDDPIDAKNHPILFTVAPLNPRRDSEKIVTFVFDKLRCKFMYLGVQAVLSLKGVPEPKNSGIVLDCGDGVAHIVPIIEGIPMTYKVQKIESAGRDLTEFFLKLLNDEGQRLNPKSAADLDKVRMLKEEVCEVAPIYSEVGLECPKVKATWKTPELDANGKLVYGENSKPRFVDAGDVVIGRSRYTCPELLFNSSLNGAIGGPPSISDELTTALKGIGIDNEQTVFQNVIISGGTMMTKGMHARIEEEVNRALPAYIQKRTGRVKVVDGGPESVWRGGALKAQEMSTETNRESWISKKDYDHSASFDRVFGKLTL